MRNAAGLVQRILLNSSLQLPFTTSAVRSAAAAAAVATASARSYASSAALIMTEFGVPEHVLKLSSVEIPLPESLGENEVLINILAVSCGVFFIFLLYRRHCFPPYIFHFSWFNFYNEQISSPPSTIIFSAGSY
jgi:hypothetical protein